MKITKAINIYLWLFTVIIALDIFTPSARSTATNGRKPALFNTDGVCLRRDAGNQREVGFGLCRVDGPKAYREEVGALNQSGTTPKPITGGTP